MFKLGEPTFQVSIDSISTKINCQSFELHETGFNNQVCDTYFVVKTEYYYYHVKKGLLEVESNASLHEIRSIIQTKFLCQEMLLNWLQTNSTCKQIEKDDGSDFLILEVPTRDAAFIENGLIIPLKETAHGRYSVV